jgi:hypothetical protein
MFKFQCVASQGIYVFVGNDKYLCEYHGQNITILTEHNNSIHIGTIVCPDCQMICGSIVSNSNINQHELLIIYF